MRKNGETLEKLEHLKKMVSEIMPGRPALPGGRTEYAIKIKKVLTVIHEINNQLPEFGHKHERKILQQIQSYIAKMCEALEKETVLLISPTDNEYIISVPHILEAIISILDALLNIREKN